LQSDLKAIEAAGVKVVGISYDPVEILKEFSDKSKITFPLLSDADSKVIDAYALRNKEMAKKKLGKYELDGVPYNGTLIVDRDGVIRAKLFEDGFVKRHSTADLIKAAEGLKKK
jgi:peroxiredoxin